MIESDDTEGMKRLIEDHCTEEYDLIREGERVTVDDEGMKRLYGDHWIEENCVSIEDKRAIGALQGFIEEYQEAIAKKNQELIADLLREDEEHWEEQISTVRLNNQDIKTTYLQDM